MGFSEEALFTRCGACGRHAGIKATRLQASGLRLDWLRHLVATRRDAGLTLSRLSSKERTRACLRQILPQAADQRTENKQRTALCHKHCLSSPRSGLHSCDLDAVGPNKTYARFFRFRKKSKTDTSFQSCNKCNKHFLIALLSDLLSLTDTVSTPVNK